MGHLKMQDQKMTNVSAVLENESRFRVLNFHQSSSSLCIFQSCISSAPKLLISNITVRKYVVSDYSNTDLETLSLFAISVLSCKATWQMQKMSVGL